MNVLLISQCTKNALKQTRRILDQFAERKGDRTWQTSITWQGLDTLRGLLKKSARKNTAVACHWIRGRDTSELLWIVGNATQFSPEGTTPTNTTQRNILRQQDENDWHTAQEIRLLAALAALLHDLGKANKTFQRKLQGGKPLADPFRHEWVSARLFEAFVGEDDDRTWVQRLAELPDAPELSWLEFVKKDGPETTFLSPAGKLPPLAQMVAWLIISHHRLPTQKKPRKKEEPSVKSLRRLPVGITEDWCGSRLDLNREDFKPKDRKAREQTIQDCWVFEHGLPMVNPVWQKRIRKHAQKILDCPRLFDREWLQSNTYVLHLARLVLMLADHHYSSLTDVQERVQVERLLPLTANTLRDTGEENQSLEEHLIGVEKHVGRIAYSLTRLESSLPRLARHRGFKRRSSNPRFQWQDKAFDLANALRGKSLELGFFGINMASTGRGKTLANGRIMYALADPVRGARFTIALGLRTLTLQTGQAYRSRLGLRPDDLTVQVGGSGVRDLYEHQQRQQVEPALNPFENQGSESGESLLADDTYVHYGEAVEEGPLKAWLKHTRGASELVHAPILACTIDHLMPATENTRGGRQIAPMLRLMSADLVLDEPDDFDLGDLPGLARLVYWAGMLGSRILLSSATLPPAIVQGLFSAYLEGRRVYQQNRGIPGKAVQICTAWFDEYRVDSGEHADPDSFAAHHREWVEKRVQQLAAEKEIRRQACIIPLPAPADSKDEALAVHLTQILEPSIYELHEQHHTQHPQTGQRVSFGLIRMANITPLVEVTRALAQNPARPGHRIHLCCYHSQHPLLVRSNIEQLLDQFLNRQDPTTLFQHMPLRVLLNQFPETDHVFVVLATPVAEVGRDHDYDWSLIEPSSMRSVIQLAGRIRRHRPGTIDAPNIYLLGTNWRSLKQSLGQATFCQPGFEDKPHFLLERHDLETLVTAEQLTPLNSTSRIAEREQADPRRNLADLEHDHLRAVMLGDDGQQDRKLAVHNWWATRAHLSGELQRAQPFRFDPQGRERYAFLYEEESRRDGFYRLELDGTPTPSNLRYDLPCVCAEGVSWWGETDYIQQVERLAADLSISIEECTRRFGGIELPKFGCEQGWDYHPALGLRRRSLSN